MFVSLIRTLGLVTLVAATLAMLPSCSDGPASTGSPPRPVAKGNETTAPASPPTHAAELLAFGESASRLRQVDPIGLRPVAGRNLKLGDFAAADFSDGTNDVLSPDGKLIALPGVNSGRLSVVRMPELRMIDRFPIVRGNRFTRPEPTLLSWPRQHTIVAFAQRYMAHRAYPGTLLVIDTQNHAVRALPLHSSVITTAAEGQRTLLLTAPVRRVGPTQLDVVGPSGRMRSLPLPDVAAGFGPGPDWDNEDVEPALLATHRFAYVASADDVVTVVNLRTLAVTEHRIVGDPASKPLGKPLSPGSGGVMWNSGRSLVAAGRHRMLYVTNDVRPAHAGNQFMQRPVVLLDTRTWKVRQLFPHVFDEWHEHGLIYLAKGRGFDAIRGTELDVIDASGRLMFRRQGHGLRWDHSAGVLVERGLNGANAVQLDPRTGRVIAHLRQVQFPFDLLRWQPPS
ncbi:MAG TPA: hypothetical protein VHV76_14180 [Mycobacteriales bacterium]|nr:hypothetical protein [Mycobacteriales bacterium]